MSDRLVNRLKFAAKWTMRHFLLSVVIGLISAYVVFGVWYPAPFRSILGVGGIYLLILMVDVVCGPLLTFLFSDPKKSRFELAVDLGVVGVIQILALAYGMHAVWIARPVVLAFEKDRFVIVTANEIDHTTLHQAPVGMRDLPSTGVLKVATRDHTTDSELFKSMEMSLAGVSPAMRPSWWQPIDRQRDQMHAKAKSLTELIKRRPDDAEILRAVAARTSYVPEALTYLPLTSTKSLDWIVLLDPTLNIVGYAPVDGF